MCDFLANVVESTIDCSKSFCAVLLQKHWPDKLIDTRFFRKTIEFFLDSLVLLLLCL